MTEAAAKKPAAIDEKWNRQAPAPCRLPLDRIITQCPQRSDTMMRVAAIIRNGFFDIPASAGREYRAVAAEEATRFGTIKASSLPPFRIMLLRPIESLGTSDIARHADIPEPDPDSTLVTPDLDWLILL